MRMIRLVCMIAAAAVASGAEDLDEIRSVLRRFNELVRKPEPALLRTLFTEEADYRDPARSVKGVNALLPLFTNTQVWSERTPPKLQDEEVRFIGSSAALADAQLVQYGSTIVRSSVPVVLVLEKEGGVWKISSWRMPVCGVPILRQ